MVVPADANRDEHARCLNIAETAINAGDFAKAERFLLKADRLIPGDNKATRMMKQCEDNKTKRDTSGASSGDAGTSGSEGMRRRGAGASTSNPHGGARASSSKTNGKGNSESEVIGTPEQRALIKTILDAGHDYYKILGVEKNADDDSIKKAYRKLALKLHPDKNKARGATDAFKQVSKAFSCLSDSEKRASYDRWGSEDGPLGAGSNMGGFARQRGSYSEFHGAEIDPEEIFNAFFGGAFGGVPFGHTRVYTTQRPRRQHQQYQQQQQQQQHRGNGQQDIRNTIASLLQILPLLLILATTFLSSGGMQEPVYSIERTNKYNQMQMTRNAEVKFYVKNDGTFDRRFPFNSRDRRRLEGRVEIEFRDLLGQQCYIERVQYQQKSRHTQNKGVKSSDMPSCLKLRELEKKIF